MKKYFLGILSIMMAVAFSAFTTEPTKVGRYDTTYWYIGSSGGEFIPGNYSTDINDLPEGTECDLTPEIPCMFVVPAGYNINTFLQYLSTLSPQDQEEVYANQVKSEREDVE